MIQQGIAPLGIELAENVIDQKQRGGFITEVLKRVSLRNFKSERGTALLSFRGILRSPHPIDEHPNRRARVQYRNRQKKPRGRYANISQKYVAPPHQI